MERKRILIICFFLTGLLLILSANNLYADLKDKNAEVYLKNGDKVTGTINAEEQGKVIMTSLSLGSLSIPREAIDKIVTEEDKKAAEMAKEAEKPWKRDIALGYSQSNGNTKKTTSSVDLNAARNTEKDEINLRGNIFYSSSNNRMDSQKWYTMGRYGLKLADKRWVNFYKLEVDHDRFANISVRAIPSAGFGYWFSDTPDWKAMTELGIAMAHTDYLDTTKTTNEAMIVPRAFFDKRLFKEAHLTEDITVYPLLKDAGDYRLHSETVFSNPVSKQLSLRISLIEDYNSKPSASKKKTDSQILSSLNYSF